MGHSQRPLPENTHHKRERERHSRLPPPPPNLSKRADANQSARPLGQWDGPFKFIGTLNAFKTAGRAAAGNSQVIKNSYDALTPELKG
jgi:hypothetical protein